MTAASLANHFEGLLFGLVLSLVCVVALLEAGLWLRPRRSGGRPAEGSPADGADAAGSGGERGWWQGLDEGEPPTRPSWPEARDEGDLAGATAGGWRPAPADDLEALAGLGGAAGGLFVLFPRKANRVIETLTAAPEPQGLRPTSRPKGGLPKKALSGD
jgi:hypothetical protein